MKKVILIYIAGLFAGISFAQTGVGIKTSTPQGPLHIDAKGDTSGAANASDDVLVTAEGRLGIGTLTPVQKVHVEALGGKGFRLSDQSEFYRSMLISRDNLGTAMWIPKPFSVQEGSILPPRVMKGDAGVNYQISDTSLFLSPGVWMIMAKYATKGNSGNFYYWTYLHDLDDITGLPTSTDKRNSADPNYYLNQHTSFKNAMSVVGIFPEQIGGYTTPSINYIAAITSPGKNPGDSGYVHEIKLTFSSSTTNDTELVDNLSTFNVGVNFFAIRLDVDMNSL